MSGKPTYEELEKRIEWLESTLLVNKTFLRQIIDLIPSCILIKDRNGKFILVNNQAASFYRTNAEDMIGRHEYDYALIHPSNQGEIDKFLADDRAVIDSGRPKTIPEEKFTGNDGQVHIFHVVKVPIDTFGYEKCVLVVATEITDRRSIKKALREGETFLCTLIDAIPIPVFYKDRAGRYIGFNRAFEKFFGKTKDELVGKSVFDINPPKLAEIYHAKDNELFESREVQRYESQVRSPGGQLLEVIFDKSVFTNEEGNVAGLIGTILDITERKRVEKERESLISVLQNALGEIKKLSGLLPICSFCKKIRDDEGYWNELEAYIEEHSEAAFSHGICRECAKKHYPDIDIYDD